MIFLVWIYFGADVNWQRKIFLNLFFSKFSNYRGKNKFGAAGKNFFYTDLILACLIVTNAPNFLRAKISLDKLVYEHCL